MTSLTYTIKVNKANGVYIFLRRMGECTSECTVSFYVEIVFLFFLGGYIL